VLGIENVSLKCIWFGCKELPILVCQSKVNIIRHNNYNKSSPSNKATKVTTTTKPCMYG